MAPGWRNRFHKRDRFLKLDDNEVEHDSDDDAFGRKEITPFSTTVSSVTTAMNNPSTEKKSLLQTPAPSRNKPLNYVASPSSTTLTVALTPRASPVSVETSSAGSLEESGGNHPVVRSTFRSARELDGFLVGPSPSKNAVAAAASAAAMISPLKTTASEDDDLVVYEAEDSSASYQVPLNTSSSTSDTTNNNPFDDDEDEQEVQDQYPLVEIVTRAAPVDLDEIHDSMDEDDHDDDADVKSVASLQPPSVNSHHTDGSEDVYVKEEEPLKEPAKQEVPKDVSVAEVEKQIAPPAETEALSPVKALVASFNNKSSPSSNTATLQKSAFTKPSIVQRSKSIPLVRPPPFKPRPVPVPIPTNVPLDSDRGKDYNSNSKDNRSRRSKTNSMPSSPRRVQDREDDDMTPIEIHGIDLLEERDHSVSELQEMSHLMTFNSLILIQKQKDWLEGSTAKGKSTSLMFELENMERKIKLLSDHKQWPNETERQKQQRDPLTPSKAFFKAMSLLDRSIEQFHQGYLSFTAKTSQENHELKRSMEQLQSKNSKLLQEAQTAQHSLQHLENESNELIKQVKHMEKHLSLVTIKNADDMDDAASSITEVCANNGTFLSKIFNIKSYIESLEEKQRKYKEEIEMLKSQVVVEKTEGGESDAVVKQEEPEIARASSADSGGLDDDLGSRWHTLEANEVATEKAAEKERQVTELCAKLADREQDLASLRSECKLIRMQLLQEERSRNEFKSQVSEKDSALEVANQRISNLEEEVLKTHSRCAAFEEDYAALKDSLATQKEATLQELGTTQEDTKAQMEKIQSDYEIKLTTLESTLSTERSEKQRLVRDLKTTLSEIEKERDELKAKFEANTSRSATFDGEEKKEPEVEDKMATDTEKMKKLEEERLQIEHMRERLAEKACAQATKIAALTEANENKDAQLTSLQEMIERLLLEREANDNTAGNQMRQHISNFRAKMREGAEQAAGILEMSRHGD